jgi:hypothetical protein
MSDLQLRQPEQGKAGYALAWLLGVPLPLDRKRSTLGAL